MFKLHNIAILRKFVSKGVLLKSWNIVVLLKYGNIVTNVATIVIAHIVCFSQNIDAAI